jgi:hypothetical protein
MRMAISTARSTLAGIDGKLDPSVAANREVLTLDWAKESGLASTCSTR